jgi:hypothetical protein
MTATICLALSSVGVVIAVITASRGHVRAGLRWFALALVPAGLYLTGLITVFSAIGHTLANWASHLVFDQKVWVGIILLGGAVLLLLGTGVRRRSRRAVPGSAPARATKSGASAGAALPATKQSAARQPDAAKGGSADPTADLGDFSDIEEILKRRGI